MLEDVLFSAAKQMGFVTEIEANKWIYKGESFKLIPRIEHGFYYEKILRMIAIF